LTHFVTATKEGRRSDITLHHFWKLVEIVEDRGLRSIQEIAKHQFPLARVLRFNGPKNPVALHRLLATDPKEFIEVVKIAYPPDTAEENGAVEGLSVTELKVEPHIVESAYHALDSLDFLPGWQKGELDSNRMIVWVTAALTIGEANNRGVYSGSSRQYHNDMSEKFRGFADQMGEWPRTREMLYAIASSEMHWVEREIERERDTSATHGIS